MRPLAILLAACCLLCSAGTQADDDLPYLATIAIEWAPGASGRLGDALVSTLHVADVASSTSALSAIDGLDVLTNDEGSIRIRFGARPTFADGDPQHYIAPSWVVDFDEAAVRALLASLEAAGDTNLTLEELERVVYEHIADKTYSRGFDLASRVAASGEGDCTEHAVLLAALARAHDFPARIVFGNLLVHTSAGLFAFGHAWTEIHDGGRWQIRDATMPGETLPQAQVRYIPIGLLRDEGPAYAMSMFEAVKGLPQRISGVANSP